VGKVSHKQSMSIKERLRPLITRHEKENEGEKRRHHRLSSARKSHWCQRLESSGSKREGGGRKVGNFKV